MDTARVFANPEFYFGDVYDVVEQIYFHTGTQKPFLHPYKTFAISLMA